MLVRCPNCKNVIRLREVDTHSQVINYLCSTCEDIVRIDLARDEIKSSSTADSRMTTR
jgi:DNA-directed RNA polymerase subunit RPC12/RpoP